MLIEKEDQIQKLEQLNKSISRYIKEFELGRRPAKGRKIVSYSNFFQDKILVIKSIRRGLPYDLFDKIKNITPFSETDWAEYLNVSIKTLQRHRNEKEFLFKPIHSEKILELAEVTKLGKEVFDSTEQFYSWLNAPSLALGKMKPSELLKDSYGKELVMDELNRIEHGIFA